MTEDAPIDRKRLLYLTAAQTTQGDKLLSIFSRLAIGILSRNFDVSIAVVGAATPAAMNRLRQDLGASRITGGFEPSKADRKVDQRVRSLMKSHHGSSLVNARLQRVVQQMAKHFDGIVWMPSRLGHTDQYLTRPWYFYLTAWRPLVLVIPS